MSQLHGIDNHQQIFAGNFLKEINSAKTKELQAHLIRQAILPQALKYFPADPVIGNQLVADADDQGPMAHN